MRYWESDVAKKNFLITVAKEKKFDPYIADNWYTVTIEDILSVQVFKNNA